MTHTIREPWLMDAAALTAKLIHSAAKVEVPDLRVSVGFPKRRGGKYRSIGECWSETQAEDGKNQIFVCPTVGGDRVLDVLIHEQIHAAVGVQHKHRKAFYQVADKVGLIRPWSATTASPGLTAKLAEIVEKIGPYPHAILTLPPKQKGPGSRYRLYECACRIKIRAATDELKAACIECGSEFVKQEPNKDQEPGQE